MKRQKNATDVKHPYEKPAHYIAKQNWQKKVTNPYTSSSYRISDLPIEWRRNKEDKPYPIKQANQIIRIKKADGREWLKSKQQWIAIVSQGNEIMESYADPEVWDKPNFQYGMRPVDKKNASGPKEYWVIGVKGFSKQYDLPFNQQNLKGVIQDATSRRTSFCNSDYPKGGIRSHSDRSSISSAKI